MGGCYTKAYFSPVENSTDLFLMPSSGHWQLSEVFLVSVSRWRCRAKSNTACANALRLNIKIIVLYGQHCTLWQLLTCSFIAYKHITYTLLTWGVNRKGNVFILFYILTTKVVSVSVMLQKDKSFQSIPHPKLSDAFEYNTRVIWTALIL